MHPIQDDPYHRKRNSSYLTNHEVLSILTINQLLLGTFGSSGHRPGRKLKRIRVREEIRASTYVRGRIYNVSKGCAYSYLMKA